MMMKRILLISTALFAIAFANQFNKHACLSKAMHNNRTYIVSPQPHTYIDPKSVPENFDWSNKDGENYLTSSRNQHIPQYCGSCWAMSATSALADRMRINRLRAFPDWMVAVQTIVYCVSNGCHGGSLTSAYEYIKDNGVGVDSCQNYIAQGSGQECTAIHKCQNCAPGGAPCEAVTKYPKVGVKEYGTVLGEEQMMAEIYARGPIVCGVDASPIENWYLPAANGVFTKGAGQNQIDHAISVTGWGVQNGTKYWNIRNSWGEYWGNRGYFKLERGDNQLGIEKEICSWAVPESPAPLN